MELKTKIIATFLVPAVAVYSLAAGVAFRGYTPDAFDLRAVGTTAAMSLLCALAQDLIPRAAKEILVFWRVKDRLPGCRAFKKQSTDRYDLSRIVNLERLRSLPGEHQQRVFYSVYNKHRGNPVVAHYSFRYLAWRDTAALYFLLTVLTFPALYIVSGFPSDIYIIATAKLVAFSLCAYVLTAIAARLSANALVGQVLSCETAEQPHAINI